LKVTQISTQKLSHILHTKFLSITPTNKFAASRVTLGQQTSLTLSDYYNINRFKQFHKK